MRAESAVARALVLAVSLALAALAQPPGAAANEIAREWALSAKDASNVTLRIAFAQKDESGLHRVDVNTSAVPYATIRGLTAADVAASPGEKRSFDIVEESGTITFTGFVGNGRGKGTYDFTTDPAFQRQLARHGMRPATDVEALVLALHHFKAAMLDDVATSGVQGATPADLVVMVDHGIKPDYLRGFKAVALVPKTMGALAELRDHGVTPQYVQAFTSAGYGQIKVDELAFARDHGVDAAQATAMRAALPSLTIADLGTLRDHGARTSLIESVARSSYRNIGANEIVRLADHGVPGSYLTDLDRISYHPSTTDIVQLYDHGVPVAFVQRLRSHGYGGMSISDMIKLYEHGI
jgi:hypothetical protein